MSKNMKIVKMSKNIQHVKIFDLYKKKLIDNFETFRATQMGIQVSSLLKTLEKSLFYITSSAEYITYINIACIGM